MPCKPKSLHPFFSHSGQARGYALLLVLSLVALFSAPLSATDWYVRPDGGSRYSAHNTSGQCDGKGDAAYPGHGVNQHCAFDDFRYLYADGSYGNKAWVIVGGDTVIVRGGPWRVGQKGPDSSDYFGNDPGDPHSAYNPTIPAGTATAHTRILGENYASCSSASRRTQLFGGYDVKTVLNLRGAAYVDVQCFDLTDHSACTLIGASNCSTNYPLSDFAGNGILTDTGTRNVLLQDLNIHGFPSRGIIGPIGGTVTANNVRIAFNGGAGWDFDDGAGTPSVSGAVLASYLTVEWNGCNEEYPIAHTYPAASCYDQNSGGYGDGVGTPNTALNFRCDHCLFRYNTQDGFDLAHVSGSVVSVTNGRSYANMGQQYKFGAMQSITMQNDVAVTDCKRMSAAISGAPANYNAHLSLFCRAGGDGLALGLQNDGVLNFQGNTVVGYAAVTFDFQCGSGSCPESKIHFEDNIVRGYTNGGYSSKGPALLYFGTGLSAANFDPRGYNVIYGIRSSGCPVTGYENEQCADPKFVDEPASFTSESMFDNYNFALTALSPAKHAGIAVPGLTTDASGAARSNPPSIGAYN